MAELLGVSVYTVRRWLQLFGLQTEASAQRQRQLEAKRAGLAIIQRECRRHGVADFLLEGRGYYRCRRCRGEAVARRRRKAKAILVAEAGGRCRLCGYDRHVGALVFHHLDPKDKEFQLSFGGLTHSIDRLRAEARKCVLLCSNCHAEVEAGVAELLDRVKGSDTAEQAGRTDPG